MVDRRLFWDVNEGNNDDDLTTTQREQFDTIEELWRELQETSANTPQYRNLMVRIRAAVDAYITKPPTPSDKS